MDPYYVTDDKIYLPWDRDLKAFQVDTTILFVDPMEVLLKVHFPDRVAKYLLPKQENRLKSDLEKYKNNVEKEAESETNTQNNF